MQIIGQLVNDIISIIGTFLKIPIERIEQHEELGNLGVDSISMLNIIEKISEQYNITLTPAKLVSVENVYDLAEALILDYNKQIMQYYSGESDEVKIPDQSSSKELLTKIKEKYNIDLSSEIINPDDTEEIVALLGSQYKDYLSSYYSGLNQEKAAPPSEENDKGKKDQVIDEDRERLKKTPECHRKGIQTQDIAIIGMSAAFSDAPELHSFWNNMINGKNSIKEIPESRWDWKKHYSEKNEYGKTISKWGAMLDDIYSFDPLFFKISPMQATLMDPQERIVIQETFKALEDAGIKVSKLSGSKTGVFIGYEYSEYQKYISRISCNNKEIPPYNSSDMSYRLANRISFIFDFRGPSEAININCASSAVAINRAYYSLLNNESDLAVAGGVCLHLFPEDYIALNELLSPDGSCRVFDENANGFTRGEGCGMIILKRLGDAIKDGDRIHAVIKSCYQNNRGTANSFSDIKPAAITNVMDNCYKRANINPETVRYIEVDGYSTKWGDSVEYDAIKEAFAKSKLTEQSSSVRKYCGLGSLKGNIGHTEPVSGIAGVIKIALSMIHKEFPATITCKNLSRLIDVEANSNPFFIVDENLGFDKLRDDNSLPVRAGVNSFADSGVNVHILMEEYVKEGIEKKDIDALSHEVSKSGEPVIFTLSARNEERLKAYAAKMENFFTSHFDIDDITDAAYTLQTGREAMEYRLAMIVNNKEELIEALKAYLYPAKEAHESMASKIFFTDNRESNYQEMKNFLSGKASEAVSHIFWKEKNLGKLADYWVKGFNVPWESFYKGKGTEKAVKKISLPTYPFEKRHYMIDLSPYKTGGDKYLKHSVDIVSLPKTVIASKEYAINALSGILGIAKDELNIDQPLKSYGFDSISFISLLQQLQTGVDPSFNVETLKKCKTTSDLINVLQEIPNQPVLSEKQGDFVPKSFSEFPELIYLNQETKGRPVFWIHGGTGGVGLYPMIAQKAQRPFYGIRPRGYMTDRYPLPGIYAMASYYAHIIQSVQPEGPYDLGGYSIGGTLAYEITRQLQELGESVNTIVMIDTLDKFNGLELDEKTAMFQAVNFTLLGEIIFKPEKIHDVLIHRKELNFNTKNGLFLNKLLTLAKRRNLNKTKEQLNFRIQQDVKVQKNYQENKYVILPLSKPESVACYYFRNKGQSFFGDLEPYFLSADEEFTMSENYWEEWEKHITNFNMIDVNSSNHMTMLVQSESSEKILEFCKKLY